MTTNTNLDKFYLSYQQKSIQNKISSPNTAISSSPIDKPRLIEFEALFMKSMLDSMRKTIKKTEKENMYENIFEDQLYEKYAILLAKKHNLGLVEKIYPNQNNAQKAYQNS